MSLVSIINQLQSIQPYRRNMSAETIALDLTRTKDSLLKMARLLQNSGRSQGNQYVPNQSFTSKRSDTLTKDLRRTTNEIGKLSGDQKRFRAFVQQTMRNVDKQIVSFQSLSKRNQNLIKSLQSEIGLGRPQRMMNYAFGTSAAQIPSYGRNIKSQLNRLSQQISILNTNQQRMMQEAEKKAEGEQRGSSAALTRQRIGRSIARERERIAGSQLPGFAEAGTKEGNLQRKSFVGGMFMFLSSTAEGKSFINKMKSIFGQGSDLQDMLDEIEQLKGGTPYKVDEGDVKIKEGRTDSPEVKELRKQLAELEQKLTGETNVSKRLDLGKEIEKLKKIKAEQLKKEGIITQELVDAGMATTKDITHYKFVRSPGAEPEYIEKAIVEKYPEIYDIDTKTGSLTLKKDWEKLITPEKIEQVSLTGPAKGKKVSIEELRTDTEFLQRVQEVSDKYGIDPVDLLAVMSIETGGTFDPRIQNPQKFKEKEVTIGGKTVTIPAGYPTGLIQFIPETAYSLGATVEQLKGMTRAEQMDYVDKYFEMVKLPRGASKGVIYSYIFRPADVAAGKTEFGVKGAAGILGQVYEQNPGLDLNNDGKITIEDLRMAVEGSTPIAKRILEQPAVAALLENPNQTKVDTLRTDESAAAAELLAQATAEENKNDIAAVQATALAAMMKADKLSQMVVKTAKDVNNTRELFRVNSDVANFSVNNDTFKGGAGLA